MPPWWSLHVTVFLTRLFLPLTCWLSMAVPCFCRDLLTCKHPESCRLGTACSGRTVTAGSLESVSCFFPLVHGRETRVHSRTRKLCKYSVLTRGLGLRRCWQRTVQLEGGGGVGVGVRFLL